MTQVDRERLQEKAVKIYLRMNGNISMEKLGAKIGMTGITAGKYITKYLKTKRETDYE